MPFATDNVGKLDKLKKCSVTIPTGEGNLLVLQPYVLPEMSESKSASYADEAVMGRSFPIKTFSHSENRTINMKWKVIIMDDASLQEAVTALNAFRSCVYPLDGTRSAPYYPPVICTLDCGILTATGISAGVCCVLRSYAVAFPTDIAWDEDFLMPYRFDIDLVWDVVYAAEDLPGRDKILEDR